MFDFIADGGIPFAESVLDGGEFGELTLPVWEDAKGFGVAVLIEFTVCQFTSGERERGPVVTACHFQGYWETVVAPEARKLAG